MPFNPASLKNLQHKGKPKGTKTVYTVADLMAILKKVEAGISKQSGKPFNFLEFLTEQAIKGNERLQIALLDRLCPIPKETNIPTTIIINNHIPGLTEKVKNG